MTERQGKCLCGAVKLTAHGVPESADACHCGMCRRQGGGSAYYAVHFSDGVTFDADETLRWYRGSDVGERGFCSACGSSIAWRLQDQPERLGLSFGVLDDTSDITLEAHIFTDSGPGYYDIPTDAPHKTGAQVIAEFEARASQAADT